MNQNKNPQSNANVNSSSNQMNKVLAQSATLLTNADSYLAGMASDSELSTGGRHHGHSRPYSSQSRVYHAHPAPRNFHLSSSRMSHYSDSMAPPAAPVPLQTSLVGLSGVQSQLPPHGHIQKQPPPPPQQQQLTHQGSVSSSGSGSSASNIYMDSGARVAAASRQLSQARPFKQSMSIDHHALGQYHGGVQSAVHHQLLAAGQPAHHLPLSAGDLAEPSLGGAYQQQQQQQAGYQAAQGRTLPSLDGRYLQGGINSRQQQMELLERQAANMNLYDNNEQSSIISQPTGSARQPLPQTATTTTTQHYNAQQHRQLPAASNISSMSVDHHMNYHHSHQLQLEQQYHPIESQQQQQHLQQHKSLHQHQQDLYGSHQVSSAPADWLPPVGPSKLLHHQQQQQQQQLHHPASRTVSQLKQTMSIDHYQINQQQHHHHHQLYGGGGGSSGTTPTGGSAGISHQFTASAQLDQHHQQPFRASPMKMMESQQHLQLAAMQMQDHLHHHQQQQQAHQLMYSEHADFQQQQQQSSSLASSANNPMASSRGSCGGGGGVGGVAGTSGEPAMHKLQQQMSSSSSNSQSGSLRSSNVDISKTMVTTSAADHQKPPVYGQRQQHYLKKGYTSAIATGLSSSNNALNEFHHSTEPSSVNFNSPHQGQHHPSSATHRAHRSVLRAASPSLNSEQAVHEQFQQQQHQHHFQQQGHSSLAAGREGAGSSGGNASGARSESSTGLPNGSNSSGGGGGGGSLTKKSNSATQLSMTGTKKRLVFRKKQVTSFSVHRSEEVAPLEARHLVKQGSSVSEGDSSMSGDSSSRSWSNSNFKQPTSDELASMSFIDGLGKGQMISRQGLASPYLGDIQLSLCDRRGNLEVEVIRARNLQAKTNKILPLTYVKLYLVKNRKCLAKAKTTLSNKRTLDPLFQQQLTFHEDYHGCILQSIIWGNFGKMDKKNFMGIAQISIDDLELSDTVISWYKLFLPSSLQTLPSKSLRHTLLSNSTESFTNTNNS